MRNTVVGVHFIYLLVKEFRGCFEGKFGCSIVLLFHLDVIYLPVLKILVHMHEIWQMNRLWRTQIYFYRWHIPDLIRLTNEIKTNLGPAVLSNNYSSKNNCAPYSSSNILSSLSNRQLFSKTVSDCQRKFCCVTQSRQVWNQWNNQKYRMLHLPL